MNRRSIKVYDLLMYTYFVCLFFYVFNISIINQFPKPAVITGGLIALSSITLFLANYKDIKTCKKPVLLSLFILFLLVTIRNGDLRHSAYMPYLYIVFVLYSIFMLSLNNKWHKIAIRVFNIFVLEHVVASIFCYLFPEFYYYHILPLFPNSSQVLFYQFNHSQIAGFTQHYSTNALYLVSGLLLNTVLVIFGESKKHKKVLFAFLLLNMLALLLTGKRSQVVAYIASTLLLLVIKYRNNLLKLVKKIIVAILLGAIVLGGLSFYIPSITNSFTRTYESITDKTVMNSRNVLYNLAIDEYKNNKLFGIGWNNYKYIYNEKVSYEQKEMDYMSVHSIYIQTLCEVGIIGSVIIYFLLLRLLFISIKDAKNIDDKDGTVATYLFIMFHLFFLMEGIFGNSLYDIQTFTPYSIILSMYLYYHLGDKRKKNEKE